MSNELTNTKTITLGGWQLDIVIVDEIKEFNIRLTLKNQPKGSIFNISRNLISDLQDGRVWAERELKDLEKKGFSLNPSL